MTVLITGAGLLGQEVARQLAARQERVVLTDVRKPEGLAEDLPGVSFAQLDVRDADALLAVSKDAGVDRIVHTAAVLSNGLRADPVLGLDVNLMGTVNILELARRLPVKRTVTISSTTVLYSGFGGFGAEPIPEDAAMRLLSDRPRSLYSATKLAGENLGMLYRDLYDVDHVSLRLAAVIGGYSSTPSSVPGQLMSRLVAAAKSGEDCVLDNPLLTWGGQEEFVDLRDCAGAVLAALYAEAPEQGVYNIAHEKLWTLSEVISSVAQIYGAFHCEYPEDIATGFAGFPHQRPAASDTSAAAKELGFRCGFDLSDTLGYWFKGN